VSEEIDLGRATSDLLSEIRTVHSRAESALRDGEWISNSKWWIKRPVKVFSETEYDEWDYVDPRGNVQKRRRPKDLGWSEGVHVPHPQRDEMRAALEKVVELLAPWAKTGKPVFHGERYRY
jgi:hypothetical protein